jgi:hypothetical protein
MPHIRPDLQARGKLPPGEPNLRCPRLDANLNLEKRGLKISRGGLIVDLCMYGRVRASYLTGWQFLERCTIPRVVFRHL